MVGILEKQYLILRCDTGYQLFHCQWVKIRACICITDQLRVIAGVGRNSISCRLFVCEGAGMNPCILEIHEIHAILVKSTDLWLFGQINYCLVNFVFFVEK